jgi:predicted ester cyclase
MINFSIPWATNVNQSKISNHEPKHWTIWLDYTVFCSSNSITTFPDQHVNRIIEMEKFENKKIVSRFLEQIENTGDVSNIREFISEDYMEVYEGERYQLGIKGAIDHVQGIRRVFPDLILTIVNQMSEGEWVVTVYSATGTFIEEWFDMRPTGKQITFTGVNVDRIRDGKIVEHGGAANLMEPLLKAGVIEKKK